MYDSYEHLAVDMVAMLTLKGLEKYLEPQVSDTTPAKTEATPDPPTEEKVPKTQTPKEAAKLQKERQDNAACLASIRRYATGKVKTQILKCTKAHEA